MENIKEIKDFLHTFYHLTLFLIVHCDLMRNQGKLFKMRCADTPLINQTAGNSFIIRK